MAWRRYSRGAGRPVNCHETTAPWDQLRAGSVGQFAHGRCGALQAAAYEPLTCTARQLVLLPSWLSMTEASPSALTKR